MTRQNETALALARWLETHPRVNKVHHAGLDTHPDHALAPARPAIEGCHIRPARRGEDEEGLA